MAMEQDDLDPLDDEDEERTTLVRRLRAQLQEQGRQLKRALEDGKQIGRDERDRELAWERSGIPSRIQTLMGEVDPRDPDALAAKAAELQADGIRWGDEAAAITARVEEQARSATLDRMSSLAAGGSVVDVESHKAAKIKARIDSHQGVSEADLAWFIEHVEGAADAITAAKGRGYQ